MKPEDVKPGDILYIWSAFYIDRGRDDICGGKATVRRVWEDRYLSGDNCNYYMVSFREIPGVKYNLRMLLNEQDKLEKEYAGKIAHRCPG